MEVGRGEVGISPDQSIGAVSQESGYSALCLAAHGQPRGKRMSEGMPAYAVPIQLVRHHGRPEDKAWITRLV